MRWLPILVLAACGASASPLDPDDVDAVDGAPGTSPDGASATVDARPVESPDASGTTADPGATGTYAVHRVDDSVVTELGTSAVTVYSPSNDNGATPAPGPFPLVVVSTGFQIGRSNYDGTCRHLASWGYVVVIHDYTSGNHQEKAGEVAEVIDWALAELGTRVDATRIALAGHSLGGKVSINAAILDARVDAVIGWDPVDALPPFSDGSTSVTPQMMAGLTVPLAVIGETTDGGGGGGMSCAPSADNYARYFEAACDAPFAIEVTIAGADHTDWVDQRSACGFACLFCGTGSTADATTLEITRRVTTAWLEIHLRGRDELASYLASPGAPSTVRTVVPGC